MGRKFFNCMQSFAVIVLILSIIGALALGYTLIYPESINHEFNETGLIITLLILIGVAILYFILQGIALLGLAAYKEEPDKILEPTKTQYVNDDIKDDAPQTKINDTVTPDEMFRALITDVQNWQVKEFKCNTKKSTAEETIYTTVINNTIELYLAYRQHKLVCIKIIGSASNRDQIKDCAYDVYKIIRPESNITNDAFSSVFINTNNQGIKQYKLNGIQIESFIYSYNIIMTMNINQ